MDKLNIVVGLEKELVDRLDYYRRDSGVGRSIALETILEALLPKVPVEAGLVPLSAWAPGVTSVS